jgi:hypothetical protein
MRIISRLFMLTAVAVLTAVAAWTLGYVCFWRFIQHSPVDTQFYFDWLHRVLTGHVGEGPSTVLMISVFTFPILLMVELGLIPVWRKIRNKRFAAQGPAIGARQN